MTITYGFALDEADTSEQFSEAFHKLVGDGVCEYGGKFGLSILGGLFISISTGFLLANGHWLKNSEPYRMQMQPSSGNSDRYDAIAAVVDYENRTVRLDVLMDIDPDEARQNLHIIRNETSYSVLLYLIRLKRGATEISSGDVTDVRPDLTFCGLIENLNNVSGSIIDVYHFLQSGIDREVSRLIALSNSYINVADEAIRSLDKSIRNRGRNSIGDVIKSRVEPEPRIAWLLCDGSAIPEQYQELSSTLGGALPDISRGSDRFKAYIYGGKPAL